VLDNARAETRHKEGLTMRRCAMTLAMLGVVLLFPLLLAGCDGDGSGGFVLGECRLDTADCRLQ
jgi:hypothetical protein